MTEGSHRPGAYRETLIFRKAPEAVERLARAALAGASPDARADQVQFRVALGYALLYQHRFEEAGEAVSEVLRLHPTCAEALALEAEIAFATDEPWPGPWDKLEARWAVAWSGERPVPHLPLWDGTELDGRAILLAAEGGLGDQIQFVRFARPLKALGAKRVVVSAAPPLLSLLRTVDGVDDVVDKGSCGSGAALNCDLAIPMLSVPRFIRPFAPSLEAPGYIQVSDEARVAALHRVDAHRNRLKVGLFWHSAVELRTVPLEMFWPLAAVPDVALFGLGEPSIVQNTVVRFPIVDLSGDVYETAAAMTAMDLVISVDTMGAHLAGALGCRTWLLLHQLPAFRWPVKGTTTPWYPTMRLFRQEGRDWESVMDRVATELRNCPSGVSDTPRSISQ